MSHVPSCLVCGTPTDSGPTVDALMRPLCGPCAKEWADSGERKRASLQPSSLGRMAAPTFARALQDWLTRTRAERRNHNPEAA